MHQRFLPCALLLAFATQAAHASPAPPPLRIGLAKWFDHASTLLLTSDKAYTIQDAASDKPLMRVAAHAVYRVTPTVSGITLTCTTLADGEMPTQSQSPVTIAPTGTDTIQIARVDPKSSSLAVHWHRYRGILTVRRDPDSTLRVINTVGLEPYLYGVIPAEIGTKVPLEAMRAQAVAARTYALKNRGKFGSEGFDLDDTTRSEGYLGVDGETALSNAAVDSTRGQVLTWHGQLIDAPYSTDSGGMTACDSSGDCPYLQAVRDAPNGSGPDYAADGKYHTWTKLFTAAAIADKLNKDPRTRVSQFVSLALDGTDASGRITTATVSGSDGAMKTVTGPQLRQILGYDSLRSTRVSLIVTPAGDYQFDGKGWGHGLGMSQDGAVAMASRPYNKSCQDILKHYYVGTTITDINHVNWNVSTAKRLP
jgi:SpoIID/LytB domain protein